ncbi:hypothetical protein ANCCAN_30273 [Ancylostoma caninum]|uniref:Uncharacterized protein n=1 Tax=Ancylostoma caninum TaxID=29170 RepID=A0A368EXJ4_ANCCA|nr:hypothetical protein ANCCAN_30273 [Ancylostoma caninum]
MGSWEELLRLARLPLSSLRNTRKLARLHSRRLLSRKSLWMMVLLRLREFAASTLTKS